MLDTDEKHLGCGTDDGERNTGVDGKEWSSRLRWGQDEGGLQERERRSDQGRDEVRLKSGSSHSDFFSFVSSSICLSKFRL